MNLQVPEVKHSFTVIGAIIAVSLQLMLAPSIAVFDVVPNFILCFVVINAMFTRDIRASVTGFVLGLAYDLLAEGAFGAMALILVLLAYVVSSLNKEFLTSSWTIQVLFLLAASFVGELLYAAELSIIGYDSDFLLSVGMRVIPTTIYSGLIGMVTFLIMSRVNEKKRPELIRSKFK